MKPKANRIVALASGSRGDVQPLVLLLAYLAAGGWDVTLCGGLNIRPLAEAYHCPFVAMGQDCEAFIARAPDPTTRPVKATMALRDFIVKELEFQFDALPQVARDADLILAATFGFAGASVAQALKKPFGFVAYCPQALPSNDHPSLLVRSHRHSKAVNWLSWRFFKRVFDLSYGATLNAYRKKLHLPPVRDLWKHVLGEKVLLACDRELSALPSDVEQQCHQTGYLHLPPSGDLDAGLQAFISAGPKPVYVGFGSMTDGKPDKTTRIVIEAAKLAGRRVVLSSGLADLGKGQTLGTDGYMVGRVSHPRLFPEMAAVVHHGGSGTTATAARAGVPQVIVPHMTDQYYFAERLPRLGLGPEAIWKKNLTPQRLAAAISAAVSDDAIHKRCTALAGELAGHDSYATAEKVIEEHFIA